MDENMFDLGFDVATISADLPDPVITLSGADSYTVQDTADYPLLVLSLYGKSVQDGTPTPEIPIDIVSVGDDGDVEITVDNNNGIALSAIVTSGLPLCSVGDYRDELIYNADGTGKIIKRIRKVVFDGGEKWNQTSTTNEKYRMTLNIGGYESLYGDNYANTTISLVVSDQYNAISYKQADEEINGIALLHTTGKYLSIYDENYATATVNEWKTHLSENPLTVIYALNTPQEIELSAAEMAELQKLQSYEGTTNIYNNEQAEMLVKMLRREFDMKYIEWLKESQTWTCPKAGKWKVICVGGGASGGLYDTTEDAVKLTPTTAGGTTSFGSVVSADGAPSTSDYSIAGYASQFVGVSGYGGYTGTSYGGVPMLGGVTSGSTALAAGGTGNAAAIANGNPQSAVGYGSGGGAVSKGDKYNGIPGRAGAIESTIVDLEEGQAIMCTIGKGGQTTDATVMGSGADGVIVVQYLGY